MSIVHTLVITLAMRMVLKLVNVGMKNNNNISMSRGEGNFEKIHSICKYLNTFLQHYRKQSK